MESSPAAHEPQQQLKMLKRELKSWEHQFSQENDRKPTKKDIALFGEIAAKYKAYARLKTFIENEAEQPAGTKSSSRDVQQAISSMALNSATYNAPDLAQKAKKYSVCEAPMSKADIGQGVDRFAKRLQEKQRAVEKVAAPKDNLDIAEKPFNIQTTSTFTDPAPNSIERLGSDEVDSFYRRKQQLDVITTVPKPLAAKSQPPSSEDVPAASLPTPTSFVPFEPKAQIIRVGSSQEIDSEGEPARNYESTTTRSSNTLSGRNSVQIAPPPLPVRRAPPPPIIPKDEPVGSSDGDSKEKSHDDEINLAPIQPEDKAEEGEEYADTKDLVHPSMRGPVKHIPSILDVNVFNRLEQNGILRCKLFRKKTMLGKGAPVYLLHNEANNGFLLSAKKVLLSKAVTYVISDHPDEISKDSPHYVAKLKANFMRTNFIVSDTRRPSKPREIVCVNYSKNVLPRELKAAISALDIDKDEETTNDISIDFKNQNEKLLFFMKNKSPRWNEATQSHCLNFGGRVTQPSIKNMQLISDATGLGECARR
ncbi:Tubby- protein 2 [Kappamyces sp. JEL0680]|nr:Tubby- protein 2 [Kappamyces sp. JEL0680]